MNSTTHLTPAKPRDTQTGAALNDILRYSASESPRRIGSLELAVGSPEQAELVAAIMREFPEVYDPTTRGCNSD
jgi:hypothetical protein